MRFMIIVKATQDSEACVMPGNALLAQMADYHEQLAAAGVLLDATGLQPSSKGWRIDYNGDKRSLLDGPFMETKDIIAGYTLIEVNSRQEAVDWSLRFPNPSHDGGRAQIEARQLFELEDFEQGEAIERFRQMDQSLGKTPA